MPGFAGIKVEGQRELIRALSAVSKDVKKQMRKELQEVAEPVKPVATKLALANISHLTGGRWSEFKIGVTSTAVYIAPAARRSGHRGRPNFGRLLMRESMIPAVKQRESEIRDSLGDWLDHVAATHGFL